MAQINLVNSSKLHDAGHGSGIFPANICILAHMIDKYSCFQIDF
jgi:hypothetical protein